MKMLEIHRVRDKNEFDRFVPTDDSLPNMVLTDELARGLIRLFTDPAAAELACVPGEQIGPVLEGLALGLSIQPDGQRVPGNNAANIEKV